MQGTSRVLTVNSVDAVPLLESHYQASNSSPLEQTLVRDQTEVVVETDHEVGGERAVLILRVLLNRALLFELPKSLDFQELDADFDVVHGGASESGQRLQAFIVSPAIHQMAGGLWHEQQHSAHQDQRRQDLNADWDEPGRIRLVDAGATDEVRAVADPERDHDAEGDGQLLNCYKGATGFGGG